MNSILLPSFNGVPDDQLTARLYQIRNDERSLLIECLAYLGEVAKRRVHLDLGYSSLFVFSVEYLGLTKGSAYRRTTAADLMARFPVVADYLADGRLNLTTLCELRTVLGEENFQQILDRAAGKSEDDVKQLVAALAPRPEPMDLLRRLPTPAPAQQPSVPVIVASTIEAPPVARKEPARIEPIAEERSANQAIVRFGPNLTT